MTWMGAGGAARMAMDLRRCGWKVRQVAGRRIWYKGQASAELVAHHMEHAWNLETTLRRTRTGGFMWGHDIAELLGSAAPEPVEPGTSTRKQRKHRLSLDVTFSHGLTKRDAAKGARLMLDNHMDLQARPVWASEPAIYMEKVEVREAKP